jgi:cell division protein FtsQ
MVREAQCYMLPSGTVCIRLSQRIPVLRIVTGDDTYFVDNDRLRMPVRESVTTPVYIATGNIGERMACNELADLAIWIAGDKYWREKIQSIHVTNPKMVYLVQRPDGTRLILGEVNGFRNKLHKLRKLYDKGFEQIGWRTYNEIDLQYKGQVIGRN